jgi:hypothetical protein
LLITDAGRAAIQAKEDTKAGEQPRAGKPALKLARMPTGGGRKAAKRKPEKQAGAGSPRAGSKLAKVIGMLTSKAGTTIEAIVKALMRPFSKSGFTTLTAAAPWSFRGRKISQASGDGEHELDRRGRAAGLVPVRGGALGRAMTLTPE